jgi:glycosyltransferase involved in cell wall biosynthesis
MNIIYLNTTEKKPSGGANIIYKHSSIINNLKIKDLTSEVLHLNKSKLSKFKTSLKKKFKIHSLEYGWKFEEISIVKNYKHKWIKNSVKVRNKFNFDQKNDFIILPEIWAHFAEDFLIKKNIKYGIFVQNGYAMNYSSNKKKLISAYRNAEFILSYSKDISQCVRTVFNVNPSKIIKTNISINFVQRFNKKNIITYMPRKLLNHSNNLLFFLQPNLPKNWIIKPIDQLNQEQTFDCLKESRIFLSFSDMEGLGMPPLEAAILGNKVIGYTGQGGNEYWKRPLFEKIENGNIIKFFKTILNNINQINNKWVKKTSNERKKLIKKYSPEQEKAKILKMIKLISHILKSNL